MKRMHRVRLVVAACAVVASLVAAQSAAAADYVSDQVIVKPRAGTSLERVLALLGVQQRVGTVDGVGAYVLTVRGNPPAVAAALADGRVRGAELRPARYRHAERSA